MMKSGPDKHTSLKLNHLGKSRSSLAISGVILPEMVPIPAGEFVMGSSQDQAAAVIEAGLFDLSVNMELPQHAVWLSGYSIAKYPVTNAEYQVFLRSTGLAAPRGWAGDDYPEGKANHPVVYVTWQDALAYCEWLAIKTNRP